MYHKSEYNEEKNNNIPFTIQCTNCGSHNVDVTAFEYWDLEIRCIKCGSWLSVGKYNETKYEGE